jgi:hypothetical protein
LKKQLYYSVLVTLLLIIVIQFIPFKLPENSQVKKSEHIQIELAKTEITNIIKVSCFDCHSNQTIYPWYAHNAPIS